MVEEFKRGEGLLQFYGAGNSATEFGKNDGIDREFSEMSGKLL
jgi:hypothetical protein